jgi:hypothetical protein
MSSVIMSGLSDQWKLSLLVVGVVLVTTLTMCGAFMTLSGRSDASELKRLTIFQHKSTEKSPNSAVSEASKLELKKFVKPGRSRSGIELFNQIKNDKEAQLSSKNSTSVSSELQEVEKLGPRTVREYAERVHYKEKLKFVPFEDQQLDIQGMAMTAHYDPRGIQVGREPVIRILAFVQRKRSILNTLKKLKCVYQELTMQPILKNLDAQMITSNKAEFVTVSFLCPAMEGIRPHQVAIVPSTVDSVIPTESLHWINVVHPPNWLTDTLLDKREIAESVYVDNLKGVNGSFDHEVALCVPAIYGDEREQMLVQFIEFYKLMGVSKIYMYSFDPSKLMLQVLNHYIQEGSIEVFDYDLPDCFTLQKLGVDLNRFECSTNLPEKPYKPYWFVQYFAQYLTIHDCLSRVSGRARWAGFIDIDEFILPKLNRHKSLPDYLNALLKENKPISHNSLIGYHFPSMDLKLCSQNVSDSSHVDEKKYSVLLADLRANPHKNALRHRTKVVVNPLLTENLLVHGAGAVFKHPTPSDAAMISKLAEDTKQALNMRNFRLGCPKDMICANPSEAMMYHATGVELKSHFHPSCQSLYLKGHEVDYSMWNKIGPQWKSAVDHHHALITGTS